MLAVATPDPPASACALDRTADLLRGAASKDRPILALSLLGAVFRDEDGPPLPIAATCDGARLAAGTPGAGITGTLADDRPVTDAVTAGYRAVEAPVWQEGRANGRGRGLEPGDALDIPTATSAAVWVRAGAGTSRILIGAGPARVQVKAAAGGAALVEVTRGVQLQHATIPAVPKAAVKVSGRRRGTSLRFVVRGVPRGAYLLAGTADASATGRARGGPVTMRLRLAARERNKAGRVRLLWTDLATRRIASTFCRFGTRSGSRLRCKADPSATLSAAAPSSVAASTPARRVHAARAHRGATAAAMRRRAAPAFPMREVVPDVPVASIPVRDLNGDGHDELLGGDIDRSDDASDGVTLSNPDGTAGERVALLDGFLAPAGDIDGDGLPDTLLQGGQVAFGTGAWSGLAAADAVERQGDPRVFTFRTGPRDDIYQGPSAVTSLPDVTGDGRPEVAAAIDGAAVVFGSSQVARGGAITIPRVPTRVAARTGPLDAPPEPIVDAAGLHLLRVVRAPSRATPASLVLVETRSATGTLTLKSTTVAIRGDVDLFARDPSSGSFLIGASGAARYAVVRLSARGTIDARASFAEGGLAAFGPDGPDADNAGEIFADGKGGLRVLPSTITGRVSETSLPLVTDLQNRPLDAHLPDSGDDGAASRSLLVQGLQGRYGDHWSRLLAP